MALRNLAVKMRIPAPAARRLLSSAPHVFPASGSRPLLFSSSRCPTKLAKEWYMLHRENYDDLARQLKTLSRVVLWTEKLERFLRRFYLVGAPLAAGYVVLKWNEYKKADEAAMKQGLAQLKSAVSHSREDQQND